jgi:hypothetical protein
MFNLLEATEPELEVTTEQKYADGTNNTPSGSIGQVSGLEVHT